MKTPRAPIRSLIPLIIALAIPVGVARAQEENLDSMASEPEIMGPPAPEPELMGPPEPEFMGPSAQEDQDPVEFSEFPFGESLGPESEESEPVFAENGAPAASPDGSSQEQPTGFLVSGESQEDEGTPGGGLAPMSRGRAEKTLEKLIEFNEAATARREKEQIDDDVKALGKLNVEVSSTIASSNIGAGSRKKFVTGGVDGTRKKTSILGGFYTGMKQGNLPFGIGADNRTKVVYPTVLVDKDQNWVTSLSHKDIMAAGKDVRCDGTGNCASKASALYSKIAEDPRFAGWGISMAHGSGHAWIETIDPKGQRYLLDPWAGSPNPIPISRNGKEITFANGVNRSGYSKLSSTNPVHLLRRP